jgi:hypothetical protein
VTGRRQYSDDKQGEIKIKVDLPRKMYTEEEPEKLKRSIEWRSKERGMLETELVFQSFTKKVLGQAVLTAVERISTRVERLRRARSLELFDRH